MALTCPKCRSELPTSAKFCLESGTPVAPQTTAEARFASPESYTPRHLAEKILTSKGALEGERKHVTVLFANLKGSMELLAEPAFVTRGARWKTVRDYTELARETGPETGVGRCCDEDASPG